MGAAVTEMRPSQLRTVCFNLEVVSGRGASSALIATTLHKSVRV